MGRVTAVSIGECVIRLTAKAEGYLDAVIDRTIPVDTPTETFLDMTWDSFETLKALPARVGADIPALAPPVAKIADGGDADQDLDDASGVIFSYQVSGDCTFDGSSMEISFSAVSECVVTVTAFSGVRSEARFSKEFSIVPIAAQFTLTWAGYVGGHSVIYGADPIAVIPPVTVPADLGAEYSYSVQGEGCEVDGASGVLTILGATVGTGLVCEVTLTASKEGYEDQTQSYPVDIAKKSQDDPTFSDPYGGVVNLSPTGSRANRIHPSHRRHRKFGISVAQHDRLRFVGFHWDGECQGRCDRGEYL